MAFIGIDLGTTYSVAAYINKDGIAEVIPNERNDPITPSVVNLGENPPIAGASAKDAQQLGDDNVHAFFKRNMGNPNAMYMWNDEILSATDLSQIMLEHIKAYSEAYLGEPVTDAVITVPAYFNNEQRVATETAGKQAGMNVLRIINEPTAAALAYGIRPNAQTDGKKYLIYDLGGGTFDVTIAELTREEIRVLGSDGDDQLGGKDWDDAILDYLASQFKSDYGVELYGDDFNALLVQAEDTKKALTAVSKKEVVVQGDGQVGRYTITREMFEEMTSALMQRTGTLIHKALEDLRDPLQPEDLDGIVLVGGSTRMPMVNTFLTKLIGKQPLGGIHPDQAVALGAAVQAAIDMNTQNAISMIDPEPTLLIGYQPTIKDVITHSLGMIAENSDRSAYINSIIIPKNIELPTSQTRPYTLRVNRQGETTMEVYMTQGELDDPQQCVYLGKYTFSDIPTENTRQVVIDVTYGYNQNGIVEVSAIERKSGKQLTMTVEHPPLEDVPERFLQSPRENEPEIEHVSVYLAFDMSGSMTGKPLTEAKKAAHGFLTQLDLTNASMGIIEFSDRTQTTLKASQNAKNIEKAINGLTVGSTGYANSDDPFDEIYSLLTEDNTEGQKYAVVLADGVWSHQSLAEERAKKCHQAGIEVIAIGFGSANKAFLKRISSREDLGFFVDMGGLVDTFSSIAQELTETAGNVNTVSLLQRRGLNIR